MIERILPETIYPTCAAVRAGDFVFISGEAGTDDEGNVVPGGFEAQARASIERVLKALNAAGCTPSHVVKVTVWLTDPQNFGEFNAIYAEYFGAEPPARTALVSQLVIDAKVEIEATAYCPL